MSILICISRIRHCGGCAAFIEASSPAWKARSQFTTCRVDVGLSTVPRHEMDRTFKISKQKKSVHFTHCISEKLVIRFGVFLDLLHQIVVCAGTSSVLDLRSERSRANNHWFDSTLHTDSITPSKVSHPIDTRNIYFSLTITLPSIIDQSRGSHVT